MSVGPKLHNPFDPLPKLVVFNTQRMFMFRGAAALLHSLQLLPTEIRFAIIAKLPYAHSSENTRGTIAINNWFISLPTAEITLTPHFL